MSDLISRADAIAYIDRVLNSGLGKNKALDYIRKYISALPSADAVHKPDYSYEADMVRRLKEALSADAVSRDCETCKYNNRTWDIEPCDSCTMGGENNHYEAEAPKGDLISRQWLLEVYGDYIGDNGEPKYHVPLEVVRQNIKDAPTIDAVKVVRCKDC